MAESSIARARRLATEKRERREAREAAESKAAQPKQVAEVKSSSLLDSIRKAFSSADDISRIDAAVDAVTSGVSQADKDTKRKK